MLNFKSILFKEKYYAISYKLNFISKSNLFKKYQSKTINQVDNKITYTTRYNKFIYAKVKVVSIEGNYKHVNYYSNDQLHRSNRPARVVYYDNCVILQQYYKYGKVHNDNGPAIICHYRNGMIKLIEYYQHGQKHRLDGPACTYYKSDGNIISEDYRQNDQLHRIDGPAKIIYNRILINNHHFVSFKREIYYEYGLRHRIGGPAFIDYQDNVIHDACYYVNGVMIM